MAVEEGEESEETGTRGVEKGEHIAKDEREPPSVDEARAKSNAQLLTSSERDEDGTIKPGTSELVRNLHDRALFVVIAFVLSSTCCTQFDVFASAKSLGTESVGLGVYFTSLQYFLVIMAIMTVLSLYPLINASLTARYTDERDIAIQLFKDNGNVVSATKSCPWTQDAFAGELVPTLGSYCSKEVSSNFPCPSVCNVNINETTFVDNCLASDYNQASINTTDQLLNAINCTVHHSGSYSNLGSQPFLRPCKCDSFSKKRGGNEVPTGVWLLVLLAQITYLISLRVFRVYYERATNAMDARSVTAGDFSIYLKRTGRGSKMVSEKRQQLAEHLAHYGEIANVAIPINTSEHIAWENKLIALQKMKHELNEPINRNIGSKVPRSIYLLFKSILQGLPLEPSSLAKQIKKCEEEMRAIEKTETKTLGAALVTFTYKQHRDNALADMKRPFFDLLFNRKAPAFPATGKRLKGEEAPEPSDCQWANFSVSNQARAFRTVIGLTIMTIVLAGGIALRIWLAIQEANSQSSQFSPYGRNEQGALPGSGALTSIISGIIVLGTNQLLTAVAKYTSAFEREATYSELETNLVFRLSISQILNAVVPVLVAFRGDSNGSLYVAGGVASSALYTQVFASVGTDLYQLLDPFTMLKRYVLFYGVRTQAELDDLFEPAEFMLSEHYASLLKSLGMAMIFGPAFFFSFPIGFVAVLATLVVDRYLATQRYKRPRRLSNSATDGTPVYDLLWVIGLVMSFFSAFVYFWHIRPAWILFLVFFGVYTTLFLSPTIRFPSLEGEESFHEKALSTSYPELIVDGKNFPDPETEPDMYDLAPTANPHHFTDIYSPLVPDQCPSDFREEYKDAYKLFRKPVQANTELLPGQKPETGGDAALPPNITQRETNLKEGEERDRTPLGHAFARARAWLFCQDVPDRAAADSKV